MPGAAAAVEDPSNSMADISAEELAAAMEAEREWEQEEKDSHSQSRARSPDGSEQDSSQNAEGQGRGRSGGEREEWGRQEAGCEDSCVEMGLSSPVIAVQCPSTGKVWQHPFYLRAWLFGHVGGPQKEHFHQGLC